MGIQVAAKLAWENHVSHGPVINASDQIYPSMPVGVWVGHPRPRCRVSFAFDDADAVQKFGQSPALSWLFEALVVAAMLRPSDAWVAADVFGV